MILIFCFILIILCRLSYSEYYTKTLKIVRTAEQMLSVEMHDYSISKTMSLPNSVEADGVQVGHQYLIATVY